LEEDAEVDLQEVTTDIKIGQYSCIEQ